MKVNQDAEDRMLTEDLEYSQEFANLILEAAAGEMEEVDCDDFIRQIRRDAAIARREGGAR